MNILIISGSPRKGGNTELLADAFAKGAAEHHHVEIVSVRDYKVNPCLGCNACFKTNGICAQKDDKSDSGFVSYQEDGIVTRWCCHTARIVRCYSDGVQPLLEILQYRGCWQGTCQGSQRQG